MFLVAWNNWLDFEADPNMFTVLGFFFDFAIHNGVGGVIRLLSAF